MCQSSRRNFIKSAAAAPAAAPLAAAAEARNAKNGARKPYRASGFAPAGAPVKISENLFLFEDTANVYIIRDGRRAILIDFGSGAVLNHLSALGISQVDWVIHTHHHRDQCQGDAKAAARGIPIAVPAHEHHLFDDAENFWRNRRVYHLYYVRNDFNTITENIPVARRLADYSTFRWNDKLDIFVLPTPGHTVGSITLIATIDGRKTAFTGDLIHSPGKIQNLYDTQINYGGAEGIDFGIYSLARLREQKPALLCPSHGGPMQDPDSAMATTIQRLIDYYRFQTGAAPTEANRPFAVSPHLVCNDQTTSTSYAIISNSGKAMFIDYGSASSSYFVNFERATPATDRMRFVEHSIDELKRSYSLKSIDVAMPSHMHDDHMNGFPHLARHHGTKIWCYENMVDIFQNPRGHNLGCILGEPFQVNRSFKHGERFRWEEFEFEVAHSPGHTEYQMALFVNIDGNRVAFTGDALFPNPRNDGSLRHNLVFRNHVENDSHLKSIRNLIAREPTMLAPGHGKPYPVDNAILTATEHKLRRQQQFFFDLLPEGQTDFGLDPSWVKLYPYQMLVKAGAEQTCEARVANYKSTPMKVEVALVAPAEWKVEPAVLKVDVPAKGHAHAPFTLRIPKDWAGASPRFAIAADVVCDGKYLGQITEAVVDVA
ncbi:MAG: MBL fold metallo-hydrolase [Acidobacteria bacterium]|nr:MBL fold metallo-hydrolase [Acidobacteriota bacterium]